MGRAMRTTDSPNGIPLARRSRPLGAPPAPDTMAARLQRPFGKNAGYSSATTTDFVRASRSGAAASMASGPARKKKRRSVPRATPR